ncbi:cyclophilin-like fold protein [Clostridium estertheticum]|uniref:cyclophilin-like fold protein n=1 Tax=Clostridium estertheticum TaxID=238834 RepID=UPI001CF49E40|nr:cyclophilin-like fold protein [Clostridium estertheticum]MCB2358541.1 hypothetical protein [Clostridium estertheticum]
MIKRLFTIMIVALIVVPFTGCGKQETATQSNTVTNSNSNINKSNTKSGDNATVKLPDLQIRFGPKGKEYTIKMDNNDTAKQIARDVGEEDWNLPIYHFDDFKNSDVMQYYDIASSYKFTSKPENVTSEKAGEVYYSDPNRIVIFYQDAKVVGKYMRVGKLENTNGLKEAVKNNPVVEGWSNKIISISPAK